MYVLNHGVLTGKSRGKGFTPAAGLLAASLILVCAGGWADEVEGADPVATTPVVTPAATDPVTATPPATNAATGETPVAPAVDLKEVLGPPNAQETPNPAAVVDNLTKPVEPVTPVEPVMEPIKAPMKLLGSEILPGTATRLAWLPNAGFGGIDAPSPVLVVNGRRSGPTLCLTAAVHGDELNGIEVIRQVMYDLDPQQLSGAVIAVPLVNLQGFQRTSRYLPDRRDLNRFFPGSASGSMAGRLAYSLFNDIILNCSALVDLHTASFYRTNLPQVRADMRNPAIVTFTEGFDRMVVVHNPGVKGTLRRAAEERGIPAVTLEAGEPMRLDEESVNSSTYSIKALMQHMAMLPRSFSRSEPAPVYYKSRWLRAPQGGILFSTAKPGDVIKKGDVLGTVTDPITNKAAKVVSTLEGQLIGMAVNQVVMPGFAAYHVGIAASEKTVAEDARKTPEQAEEQAPE